MPKPFTPSDDPESTALAIAYLLLPPISSASPEARARQIGELARSMLAAVRAGERREARGGGNGNPAPPRVDPHDAVAP